MTLKIRKNVLVIAKTAVILTLYFRNRKSYYLNIFLLPSIFGSSFLFSFAAPKINHSDFLLNSIKNLGLTGKVSTSVENEDINILYDLLSTDLVAFVKRANFQRRNFDKMYIELGFLTCKHYWDNEKGWDFLSIPIENWNLSFKAYYFPKTADIHSLVYFVNTDLDLQNHLKNRVKRDDFKESIEILREIYLKLKIGIYTYLQFDSMLRKGFKFGGIDTYLHFDSML